MIVAIKGILHSTGPDWVQVSLGGLTIHILVPTSIIQDLGELGYEIQLHTHLLIKDDVPQAYGFSSPEGLQLFQLLMSVSGIGPRSALNVLSAFSTDSLANAIVSEDINAFTGIPGVGKKSVARIILELKSKVELYLTMRPTKATSQDSSALSALTALGYTTTEAREALNKVAAKPDTPLEDKVRQALGYLSGAQ